MLFFDVDEAIKILSKIHPKGKLPEVMWSWKEVSTWMRILGIHPIPLEREFREEIGNLYPDIEWIQKTYNEFLKIVDNKGRSILSGG